MEILLIIFFFTLQLSGEGNVYAEALWDHETLDSEELPFQSGDVIEVTDTSDQDWWWGTKDGLSGWFPSAFVRVSLGNVLFLPCLLGDPQNFTLGLIHQYLTVKLKQ